MRSLPCQVTFLSVLGAFRDPDFRTFISGFLFFSSFSSCWLSEAVVSGVPLFLSSNSASLFSTAASFSVNSYATLSRGDESSFEILVHLTNTTELWLCSDMLVKLDLRASYLYLGICKNPPVGEIRATAPVV